VTPASVVQRQLEAYNRHDLKAFLDCYGEDARIIRLPALEPWLTGKAQIEAFYASNRFNVPTLKAEILHRITFGNKVVDHERVHGLADNSVDVVVVYEVIQDWIEQVWFHRPT
jgi:hypothetical protein